MSLNQPEVDRTNGFPVDETLWTSTNYNSPYGVLQVLFSRASVNFNYDGDSNFSMIVIAFKRHCLRLQICLEMHNCKNNVEVMESDRITAGTCCMLLQRIENHHEGLGVPF